MSFPSEGRTAMFRNPMTEVSKFMKTKDRIYPFDRIDPFDRNGLFDIDPYEIEFNESEKASRTFSCLESLCRTRL